LGPAITSLGKIIHSKDALLTSVCHLSNVTQKLTEMVSKVSLIAAYTNLMAINAAIESQNTCLATGIRKLFSHCAMATFGFAG
jgi:methyl-accepting chemotaxis protein